MKNARLFEFYTCLCELANDFSTIHHERVTALPTVSISPPHVAPEQHRSGVGVAQSPRRKTVVARPAGQFSPLAAPLRRRKQSLFFEGVSGSSFRQSVAIDATVKIAILAQIAPVAFRRKPLADSLTLPYVRPTINGIGGPRASVLGRLKRGGDLDAAYVDRQGNRCIFGRQFRVSIRLEATSQASSA